MRSPDFWTRHYKGPKDTLAAPLGWLYSLAARTRRSIARPWHAPVPVICVGNLVLGGAGKTPVAFDLAVRLKALGRTPHIVSRGYGGTEIGPTQVDVNIHAAKDVGDEPLLLSAVATTWVAKDRIQGCRAAIDHGADVIVLDDGFQNPTLGKDLSLIVVDGSYGFGNGKVFPAGPLREPIGTGLNRAQAVVMIGADQGGVSAIVGNLGPHKQPILRANVEATNADLAGKTVIAFAGIGMPEKFFKTLKKVGANVVKTRSFSDHHPYTAGEITELKLLAATEDATLVTTAKDAVRLPLEARESILVLDVSLTWKDETAIDALLSEVLK